MQDDPAGREIAFVGFGEAAGAFAEGWGLARCAAVAAYDLKLDDAATAAGLRARAGERGVACGPHDRVVGQAAAVFCLVTADQAGAAAAAAAPVIAPGALWLDGNSVAPQTKRRAAERLAAAGADYVDVAIMAPVFPRKHETPMLISGPGAARALPLLDRLGMKARLLDARTGSASAVKMIRSVMIKGMEALFAECLLSARRAGVEGEVLASLAGSNPEIDWPAKAAYNLERMMLHGRRRAAEMREVAATVAALGLPPGLSAAGADWQERIGDLGLEAGEAALLSQLDAILARL